MPQILAPKAAYGLNGDLFITIINDIGHINRIPARANIRIFSQVHDLLFSGTE